MNRLGPQQPESSSDQDLDVIVLVRNGERYAWIYHESEVDLVLRSVGSFAANPALSFSWRDAADVAMKLRKIHRHDKT